MNNGNYSFIGYEDGTIVMWSLTDPLYYTKSKSLGYYQGQLMRIVDMVIDYTENKLKFVAFNEYSLQIYESKIISQ